MPDEIIDGEILEADPPRRLSMTWRMLMDPGMEAEGFTKLTYEIEATESAGTKLTVIHELEGAPTLAAMVAGEARGRGRRRRLGLDRSPTSSRCSRRASRSPTETPPAWRAARSGGSPACYSSSRPATRMPSSRARPSPMRRARPGTSAMIRKPSTSQPATISGKTV